MGLELRDNEENWRKLVKMVDALAKSREQVVLSVLKLSV